MAGGNRDIDITVKNSTITGWCAAQTWSANSKLTFENCTLIGTNDKPYNKDGWNDFATIVVNEDAANSVLNFKNCKIVAAQTTGNTQYFLSMRTACDVTFDNCSFVKDGVEVAAEDVQKNIEKWNEGYTVTIK